MSERGRAFQALEGRTFPRVGDHGRYIDSAISLTDPLDHRAEAAVEVVKVTASGKTATVLFIEAWARNAFAREPFRVYRRGDGRDGSGWYLPHGRSGLHGEVVFARGAHAARPWRLK